MFRPMKLALTTPILEFPRHEIAKLSPAMTQKLAVAVAGFSNKTDPAAVTVFKSLGVGLEDVAVAVDHQHPVGCHGGDPGTPVTRGVLGAGREG